MKTPRALLAALLVLLAQSSVASADVAGPRELCDVEGLPCESCWQHYGSNPADEAAFTACREALAAKGLFESCRHRQGAGDTIYFCPPGMSAEKTTRYVGGGGCAGCATSNDAPGAALAALAVGLGIAAVRRRRAR
jgi:MYXO-CTERM domain-containing protein